MQCPQCNGSGILRAAFVRISISCDLCLGSGFIDAAAEERVIKGRAMQQRRIESRMTLRDAAKAHGIDVAKLSAMERGVIECEELY